MQGKQEPASYHILQRPEEILVQPFSAPFQDGDTKVVGDLLQTAGNSLLTWKCKLKPVKQGRQQLNAYKPRVYYTYTYKIFILQDKINLGWSKTLQKELPLWAPGVTRTFVPPENRKDKVLQAKLERVGLLRASGSGWQLNVAVFFNNFAEKMYGKITKCSCSKKPA